MVCGSDDAEGMATWGEANGEWLGGILDPPHGPPSQDVFLAVFGALDPVAFSTVFRAWVDLLLANIPLKAKHIAIDGKTSRQEAAFNRPPGLGRCLFYTSRECDLKRCRCR